MTTNSTNQVSTDAPVSVLENKEIQKMPDNNKKKNKNTTKRKYSKPKPKRRQKIQNVIKSQHWINVNIERWNKIKRSFSETSTDVEWAETKNGSKIEKD